MLAVMGIIGVEAKELGVGCSVGGRVAARGAEGKIDGVVGAEEKLL